MRTTLDLNRDLLVEAMKASHVRTKTAVVELGLQELIRQSKIEGLRKLRGRLNFNINLDRSRKR